MERGAAAAVWRLRATGGHRDRRDCRHPPPREDGDRDTGGKKRGGPRRRALPLPEGRAAPLVLLYLLGLRALVHVSHRQLLSQPPAAGPRDFSASRARYRPVSRQPRGRVRPAWPRGRRLQRPGPASGRGRALGVPPAGWAGAGRRCRLPGCGPMQSARVPPRPGESPERAWALAEAGEGVLRAAAAVLAASRRGWFGLIEQRALHSFDSWSILKHLAPGTPSLQISGWCTSC